METTMKALPAVDEFEQITQIEEIAARYQKAFHLPPINVSHWDPSEQIAALISERLVLPDPEKPLPYIYSYTLELRDEVLRRLGFDPTRSGCLIVPNGTTAMLCAVNWITARRAGPLRAFGPLYFPLVYQSRVCALEIQPRFLERDDTGFRLPRNCLDTDGALWLTNPIYCTSVPVSAEDREKLHSHLTQGGPVVLDECFVAPGEAIGPTLAQHSEFVALYAPHKALCLNGLKFSVVVFNRRYQTFFDQWADVLCGPLNLTNVAAVKHFLSDNFTVCWWAIADRISDAATFVRKVFHAAGARLDWSAQGNFLTVYFPSLSAAKGSDGAFLWSVAETTGAVFLPGTRNHFDPAFGLCFRINLALDGPQFRAAIVRLGRFLGGLTSDSRY